MKISIVTISYNQGEFLERCIRSVIEQDYDDIEYIVVDPGSTDGSREIIEKYRNEIDKIIFEPDKGPADGLNKGFAIATGDIFGFLNSDDIFLPNALSQAIDYLKKNPFIDVVSGAALIIDEADRTIRKSYSDNFSLIRCAYDGCILIQPSTFFRRSAFAKAGGFNVQNINAWDGELWVDMALAGMNFAAQNNIWSGFRLHVDGITASGRTENLNSKYRKMIFQKITKKEQTNIDRLISIGFRFFRKLSNPRDTVQRILHGPIYGRKRT